MPTGVLLSHEDTAIPQEEAEGKRMLPANVQRVPRSLLAVNAVGAAAAAVFATVGVVRPAFARPDVPVSPLARFWAASSAIRTWALIGPLLAGMARRTPPSAELLRAAGLVQLLDAGLGVQQRNPPMTVLPAVMGTVHLISANILTGPKDQ